MSYELIPIYDHHKSFYGKAIVSSRYNKIYLHSYGTLVATIYEGRLIVYGTYSATTLRHIKEFIRQHGFPCGSKSFIEETYSI